MKYLKKMEGVGYDPENKKFIFNPAEYDNTVTFYLHKQKQGFSMDIADEDREKLEEILKKNKIDYTVSAGNVLPF